MLMFRGWGVVWLEIVGGWRVLYVKCRERGD